MGTYFLNQHRSMPPGELKQRYLKKRYAEVVDEDDEESPQGTPQVAIDEQVYQRFRLLEGRCQEGLEELGKLVVFSGKGPEEYQVLASRKLPLVRVEEQTVLAAFSRDKTSERSRVVFMSRDDENWLLMLLDVNLAVQEIKTPYIRGPRYLEERVIKRWLAGLKPNHLWQQRVGFFCRNLEWRSSHLDRTFSLWAFRELCSSEELLQVGMALGFGVGFSRKNDLDCFNGTKVVSVSLNGEPHLVVKLGPSRELIWAQFNWSKMVSVSRGDQVVLLLALDSTLQLFETWGFMLLCPVAFNSWTQSHKIALHMKSFIGCSNTGMS